ncbi:MAG: peptide deformylase [Acidimicrobiales bacterium]
MVVQAGSLGLRRPSYTVDLDAIGSPELAELIDALHAGLASVPGVGLAAPQIGVPLRVVLVQDPPEFHTRITDTRRDELEREVIEPYVLINPEIEAVGSERRTFFEGCLSVDGYCALVTRARTVRCQWLDPDGKAHEAVRSGWHARILQHEIDHLNGVLYVDRMYSRSFMTNTNHVEWVGRSIEEIREAFGIL